MDRQQKIDFVRGIWEAFARGDMKTVFAAMPEDVARVKRVHIDLRRRPERLHKNVDLLFAMIDSGLSRH